MNYKALQAIEMQAEVARDVPFPNGFALLGSELGFSIISASPRNPVVTVVTLRASERNQHAQFEEASRHLSVRFIVRGHWRNQWYPSEGRNKPIWIMPYVKGPDGAPVTGGTKLYNVAR